MKLTNKTVLIAGASSGIGQRVAEQLSLRNNTLIITGRRTQLLEEVAATVRANGSRCFVYRNDASDEEATAALIARAIHDVGRIDAALLNIGMGPAYNMATTTVSAIAECMTLNYNVTVNYLVPLIAHMKGGDESLIVHTNSLAGFLALPMQGPYSAAKSAVRLLMDTARTELKDSAIRFLTVYPGFIATAEAAKDEIPAPFEISEERAARYIIKAMESNRNDYAFPWPTARLTSLLRALPKPLAGSIMRKMVPADY